MDSYNYNPENFDPERPEYGTMRGRRPARHINDVDRPEPSDGSSQRPHDPDYDYDYDRPQQRRRTTRPADSSRRDGQPRDNRQHRNSTMPNADKLSRRRVRKSSGGSQVLRMLRDRRLHGVIGIAMILFALYILVTGFSFVRNCAADQSLASNMTVSEIVHEVSDNTATVDNTGGPAGAKISHALFTESFGIGTLVIVIYLTLIGLSLLRLYRCNIWSLTFKSLIDTVTLSLVSGLITYPMELPWPVGGYHGRYVNQWLIEHTGVIGDLFVNMLLVTCVIFIYLNELRLVINKYRALRQHRRELAEQRRLEEEERQERVRRDLNDKVMGSYTDSDDCHDSDVHRQTGTVEFNKDDSYELTDIATGYGQSSDSQPQNDNDLFAAPATPTSVTVDLFAAPGQDPRIPATSVAGISNDNHHGQQPEEANFAVEAKQIEQSDGATVDESETYDPTAELSRYVFPSLDLLHQRATKTDNIDLEEQEENQQRITKTLNDYGIPIQKIRATVGPTVTLYEIIPAEGVRIAKIKRLEDDIALSLSALGIRIIAPIPGKGTIGIEVPNKDPQTVSIHTVLGSKAFRDTKCTLPMAMGATISNEVYIADLAKMPHLLVAGATGQGKSVGLNTIIASLLYKLHPSRLKFVLIDPKSVEFSLYSKLERHYLAKLPDEEEPVVTAFDKVERTLNSLCVEMDNRYKLLKDAGVRTLIEYNDRFVTHRLNPEKGHRFLPYIVIIVDEFADLIMMSGKSVEMPIARIAQKARAVGMHMIIATQRPSTNVITGIIKANFPGRIAFRVSQGVDSKTILDRMGANQLIGRGDMLFSHNGSMDRVQCAFIDTDEVEAICNHIDAQVGFEHAYYLPEPIQNEGDAQGLDSAGPIDPLFEEAAQFIVSSGSTASTSSLQRRYSIGYNRAGKIMDQLESAGIVGPASGAKPRQVLLDPFSLDQLLQNRHSGV